MQVFNTYRWIILLSIPLISIVLHFHVFNKDLIGIHVWRQTQTQTVINNYYKEDMNIMHPKRNAFADTDRLLLMEFPIMQWIFALFFKIFGPHIIISRVLSFLIGLLSVWGMYQLTGLLFNNKSTALIAAWCFNFSPVFYYYTLNPLPDNFALCCAIWSTGLFIKHTETNQIKYFILSIVLLCLATLAKLPFVLYALIPITYYAIQTIRLKQLTHSFKIFLLFSAIMLPAAIWYAYVIPTWPSNGVISGMFNNSDKTNKFWAILWGNIVSVFPELLINYAALPLFITGCVFAVKNKIYNSKYFSIIAICLLAITGYFLFELNMIDTVHDYYLFPFLPFIFIVVAYGAQILIIRAKTRIFVYLCLLLMPLTAYLRINNRWDETHPGFNPVYYTEKETIRKIIPDNALCIVGNDESNYILLYYIDKKGWAYANDKLDNELLISYIHKGAQYFFTDSHIDSMKKLYPLLSEKIYEKESLRVYKLKNL